MARPAQGIRIAELVRRSGTSKETIHFYLREGLLAKPRKTSRNMAWYDETHVEQLKLIKRLRTESYLPLSVIKKVLKEGRLGASARKLDLAGDLFGRGARTEHEPLTRAALAERTGLSEARIVAYEAAGLLRPRGPGELGRYGPDDVRVAELLKVAEDEAGEGAEALVLERFVIFERHLAALVKDEVAHFFGRVVTGGDPARALELLRTGRETIGRFLAIARARRLHEEVESMVPEIERALGAEAPPSARPEPFFFPLPTGTLEGLGEPAHRRTLTARFEEHPADPDAVAALLLHLLLVGDAPEVIALEPQVKGRAKADVRVAILHAAALLEVERSDDAFHLLDQLRGEPGAAPAEVDPMLEALWGSVLLIRLRDRFTTLVSSTELIGYITRALAAFERARSTPAPDPLTSARIHLTLGRIGVGAPSFLGTREQAQRDLERVLVDLQRLDPARSFGAHERLALNARYFLRRG